METVIANDRGAMGRYVAAEARATLQEVLATQPECNLVIATGSSQFEVLDQLVGLAGIDWQRVNGYHLDEYLGIPSSHSASFCGYLASRFVDRLPLKSFYYLDGTRDPQELKREADSRLAGRRIDLLLCGIGENGHLAFNDPPADMTSDDPYLIVQLDEACRRQQVGEGWFDSLAEVPVQAISMSIRQIMKSDRILCAVPDRRKAEAVRDTLTGPVSPDVPASVLTEHTNATLVLDTSSSSLLSAEQLAGCVHWETQEDGSQENGSTASAQA